MFRQHEHGGMTVPNGSPGARRAAMRSPARLVPYLLLALAAALALLLSGGLDTANAQETPEVLISNIGQTTATGFDLPFSGTAGNDYAQAFTTGTNPGGYVLSSIKLRLKTDAAPVAPTVKLFRGSADGTELATLTLDGSLTVSTTANFSFAVTGIVILSPSTTTTARASRTLRTRGGRRRRRRGKRPSARGNQRSAPLTPGRTGPRRQENETPGM